jgi:O-antigen/teichoic acid export membrane protein
MRQRPLEFFVIILLHPTSSVKRFRESLSKPALTAAAPYDIMTPRKGGAAMLLIIHGLVTASLIALGALFSAGKGASLIAGYNTASKGEKQQIDEKKLCTYTGRLMFLLAACWFVILLSNLLEKMLLLWLGLAGVVVVTLVGVIYMNTGGRLKRSR